MTRALAFSILLALAGLPAFAQEPSPTHENVKYGPHMRNIMDVWLAKSDNPSPVLVSIHGGGFRAGNKSVSPDLLRRCLASGISVVAITYRLSDHAIAPAQFHDAARAIQFIRHKGKDWDLGIWRIAATGNSAGAGLSLWLAFMTISPTPGATIPSFANPLDPAAYRCSTGKRLMIPVSSVTCSEALSTRNLPWQNYSMWT